MFGGLEIKGVASTKEEKPPALSTGSSFSFITGSSIPTPIESAAPPSAFSFIAPNAQDISQEAPPPAAGPSAFSFLSEPEVTSPSATVPKNSGFTFVNIGSPLVASDPPPSSFVRNTSDEAAGGGIVGAGVSFGGAGAAQRKNIKRRSRAPKVGAAVSAILPMYGSTGGAVSARSDDQPPVMTRDEAEDAVRRAEEFLQKKQEEESKLVPVTSAEPPSEVGLSNPASIYSPDIDDELVEAQRAAEEAQARLAREATKEAHPSAQKSAFSWFGGLRSKGNNDASERSVSNGGVMSGASLRGGDQSLMIPTPDPSQHSGPETQAEKMLREQEEIKRAMAERHMMKLAKQENFEINPAETVWDRPPIIETTPSWGKTATELAAGIPPTIPSWGVKAAAPPPPSSRQLFDIILQQFASDVQKAMNKVDELRQQRNMLLEERFLALAKERLATQQIIQTETQQMDAAENEDFELAERLQVVLEGHNREKAECTAILDNIGKALAQLDEQSPRIVNGVTKCFENVAIDLEAFKVKQKHADDPSDVMARFAATARQLSDENERLKAEAKALERDEELVKMERMELDDAIAEQTAELEKLRDQSSAKLSEVEREMDELREKLRLKEIEAQQLKMQLLAQDADISKVLVKFNRQITRVQKKEMSLSENHKEWTNESNAYLRLKDAHDAEVAAHSEELLQRNTIMNEIMDSIAVARTFQDVISQAVTFEHIREEDEEVDGNLAQIQADLVKCEAAVSEAAQLAKAAEACLVSLDGESRRIQEKLPKLEEEKLKAAAKRDFKTAGRASKEIKEYTARLHELEETLISAAKVKHYEAKQSLERVQEELERELATANAKEKESGKISMDKIAKRIKALVRTKKKVCGKSTHDSVRGVGSLVLQGQIDALKAEGQSLGHKFGGWDEAFGSIDDSDDDEVVVEQTKSSEISTKSDEEIRTVEPVLPARGSDEIIQENVEKALSLQKKLAQIEAELECAAEEEDFEKAAELDEHLQDIKDQLEQLDLTDAEADLVMSSEEQHGQDGNDELLEESPTHDTDGDAISKASMTEGGKVEPASVISEACKGESIVDSGEDCEVERLSNCVDSGEQTKSE